MPAPRRLRMYSGIGGPRAIGSSGSTGSTGVGGTVIVRRTADSNTISTDATLNADDTLLWNVAANEVWFVEAFLLFTGTSATEDVKIGWTVPASTTMSWGTISTQSGSGTGYGNIPTASTVGAVLTESGELASGSVAGTWGVSAAGIVVVSTTAGAVTLGWAQNASDAGTLKILANSFLRATRLA